MAEIHRGNQVAKVLVHQPVSADRFLNLGHGAIGRDQLVRSRHVDSVNVLVADRRRGRGEIHLVRTRLPSHFHNLPRGGAAHDGIVHQQHVLAPKFQGYGIELLAHRAGAFRLPRHDESATDVAVLDKALAVLDV